MIRATATMTLEEFLEQWPTRSKPEDVDYSFAFSFIDKRITSDLQIDKWFMEIPIRLSEPIHDLLYDLIDEDFTREELVVKIYEKLCFFIANPDAFLESENEDTTQVEIEQSDDYWYAYVHEKLPKHIVDILRLCGNHVVKPVTDNKNSFTYMKVEELAEEIQGIIEQCKMGS